MRNYIILNGINSNEINGLLIQELPPISKPKIRTQIEEIDGRDGDIVTKLGFSAYDKEFTIGLYGDFDIDEIISFFNSEGTVTFSNEVDKYYNYQILDQIDFERLVRYRTATVTMHVQPFKYSNVEGTKNYNVTNELINFADYSKTSNGVTLTASDGTITIQGTPTAATEFYVPINKINLAPGTYTLTLSAQGTNPNYCSIRLIGSAPSDADSFANRYITLADGDVQVSATLTANKQFGYLWFYMNAGTNFNFSMNASMQNGNPVTSINVINNGNYISKPTLTIYGSGTINLSLNDFQVFVINLGDEGNITIDTALMEAYNDGTLKNRLVTGNYDNFALNQGTNTISWTGNITQIDIENYSRWV